LFITILLYLIGIVIGLYAIFHNIPFLFNVDFSDPYIGGAKLLQSLIPIVAGGFIVYICGENLFIIFKKHLLKKEAD